MKDYCKIAKQYARDIVSGKIPAAKITILTAKRQLSDLDRQGDDFHYIFNPVLIDSTDKQYFPANRICAFAERLTHVKGVWTGKPIVLEPWQVFLLTTLFGWVHKETGLRRFRELYAEIPRKNGKSILGAIIGLYMFCADGEGGSEVFSGATTEKQAWEVFRPARLMAKKSQALQDYYSVEIHAKDLSTITDYSRFEPLIGDPGDGASPHCALIDEFHEHKTPAQYDTMATGMGARAQPLLCVITTAGSNLAGPCYEKRMQVKKILEGVFDNDEILAIIYTVDDDDDWDDFKNWEKANPNFGVSVFPDYLRGRLKTAIQNTSKQNIVRCKHLNQWLSANQAFFNILEWEKCQDKSIAIDDFEGEQCWIGLDLASKVDIAALMLLFKRAGKWYVFGRYYLPEDTINKPENPHYQGWEYEDYLISTPGPVIDFDQIEEDFTRLASRFEIAEIGYDPFQATQLSTRMTAGGFPMVEVRPTVLNFSEPMKQLESLILEKRIVHDGNPVLTWMISNTVAHYDKKDNVYPNKEHVDNKIDGVVALLMALGRAITGGDPEKSIYEERGCLFL